MPLRGPVPVLHQTRENSEKVQVGPTTIYIFEDGTHTDNRVGCMLLELPAGASGPPSEFLVSFLLLLRWSAFFLGWPLLYQVHSDGAWEE